MTPAEKKEIVSEVLDAIKTMSTSIPQMTAVTSVPAGAYVELNGARKIALDTIINDAVQRALAAADITGLNQRITTLSNSVERDIRSLGNAIDEIPIVHVDSALDVSSNNAISNKAVTNAISKFSNLANAIGEIPVSQREPVDYERSALTWNTGDVLVAWTFDSGYDAGKTRILLYRPSSLSFFSSWSEAPEGYSMAEVFAVSRIWLIGNNIFQGTGRDGFIQPLGAMMAQHNILSQEEYDVLPDSTKDQFELFLTY